MIKLKAGVSGNKAQARVYVTDMLASLFLLTDFSSLF
jgi:hypothetical protein